MADNKPDLPHDEDKSQNKVPKFVIGAGVIAFAYFVVLPQFETKAIKEIDKIVTEEKQEVAINSNLAALDVKAAFQTFQDRMLKNEDQTKKQENALSRIQKEIKKNREDSAKQFKEFGYEFNKKQDELAEQFRKYQDLNSSRYLSPESNIEIGGVTFESELAPGIEGIESNDSSQPAQLAVRKNPRKSNYISFFDKFEDGANALEEAAGTGLDAIDGIMKTSNTDDEKQAAPSRDTDDYVVIPAQSWIDANSFHGLRCPIINGLASVAGSTKPSPVTFRVRGIFHGPNGDEIDIGPVHIAGVCTGQRTGDEEYGIADIELKRLSYSIGGEKKDVSLEGYILDRHNKDFFEQPGLRGPIDAVQATTLADSAWAAALSMISLGFKSTQTATVTNLATSTETSSFEGNPMERILADGLGAYFIDMYDSFKALKDTAVDAVLTPSGANVRIFTSNSFSVPREKVQEDPYFSQSDSETYL